MSQETSSWLSANTLIGFTSERGNAWHYRQGDGNHFNGPVPLSRVRKLFGWEPLIIPDAYEFEGKIRKTGKIKVLRSDNGDYLGTFSEGYKAHAYQEWLVSKVETLLGDGLGVGSAGLLRNGAQAWVSVEVPETVDVKSVGEKIRPSLTAATSLDGSLATTYFRNITRIVCDNTLSFGLAEKIARVKVKHTRGSVGKLNIVTARDALGIVFTMAEDYAKEIELLASTKVTEKQWAEFLTAHMGDLPSEEDKRARTFYETKFDHLQNLWRNDERVAPWSHTAWGVLQAVNTYEQHLAIVRGTARPIRNLEKTVKGEFEKTDLETLDTLVKVIGR